MTNQFLEQFPQEDESQIHLDSLVESDTGDIYVRCAICGEQHLQITVKHLERHNISYVEYKKKFPLASLVSKETHTRRSNGISGDKNPSKRPEFSERMSGDKNPAKRPEVRKKISLKMTGRIVTWANTEGLKRYQELHGNPMKGKIRSDFSEYLLRDNPMKRPEIAEKMGKTRSLHHKLGLIKITGPVGYQQTEEHKANISRAIIQKWMSDLEYQEAVYASRKHQINKTELRLLNILEKYFTGWRFVGDGYTFIAGKVPDFINFKKKKIIEMFGAYWHDKSEEKERIEHFKKFGYDCLVIWDYELDEEEKVIIRVTSFLEEDE